MTVLLNVQHVECQRGLLYPCYKVLIRVGNTGIDMLNTTVRMEMVPTFAVEEEFGKFKDYTDILF